MKVAERYRQLIRNTVNDGDFVLLHFRLRAAGGVSMADAALSTLLILTRRTLRSVGSLPDESSVSELGAVVTRTPLRGSESPVTLAIPRHYVDDDDVIGSISLIATSASEYSYCDDVWLEDVDLPATLLETLQGPHHGVDGIRKALQVQGRPILAAALPIRHLPDEDELRRYVRSVLLGGVDLVTDDIITPTTSQRVADERRVEIVQEEITRENERRAGSSVVGYFYNATGTGKALDRHLKLVEALRPLGLIANCAHMGYGTVQLLATQEFSGHRPIVIASNMGSSMLGRNPLDEQLREVDQATIARTGVAEVVTAKLSRLAGADAIHTGTAGAECWHPAEFNATPTVIADFIPGVNSSMAVAEGDLPIHEVGTNVSYLRGDVILESMAGLAGHPSGPRQGADAYAIVCRVVHHSMSEIEHESALLQLSRKYNHVDEALHALNWRPSVIPPDEREANLLSTISTASWIDDAKLAVLRGRYRGSAR